MNGFTLIELLVVIAIISLLVSILLPSLSRAKNLAKRVVCATNLKHCGSALTIYADDNDEWLCRRRQWWSNIFREGPALDRQYINYGLLMSGDYLTRDLLYCPAGEKQVVTTWSDGALSLDDSYWFLQPVYDYYNQPSLVNKYDEYYPAKLSTFPHNIAVMTDYMLGRTAYFKGFWHGAEGLNASFIDGSAYWVADSRLYERTEDGYVSGGNGLQAVVDCWEYIEETH